MRNIGDNLHSMKLDSDYTESAVADQEPQQSSLEATVTAEQAGMRLDQALARLFPDYSRSRLQAWTREGRVSVNGEQRRPRDRVERGDHLRLRAVAEEQVDCVPQPIPLDIVFEDRDILVINKPAGLVVHPAAGNPDGTLQNALLYHDPGLVELPRAGLVPRLDTHTTGLMVIARSQKAHKRLVDAISARSVRREYRALVVGGMPAGGTIELPIGRFQLSARQIMYDSKSIVCSRISSAFSLRSSQNTWTRLSVGQIRSPISSATGRLKK